jgi:hypothetical protein
MSSNESTETRGGWLWRRLAAIFGARFLDMWRDIDPAEVQAEWSTATRGLSREALMRGISACYHMRAVPTLPEFLDACRSQPAMYTPHSMLTDERRSAPEHAREQLAHIREIATAVLRDAPARGAGTAWARRIVEEAAQGTVLPGNRLQIALDALRNYGETHGTAKPQEPELTMPTRVPSPHIYDPLREPGCDDEELMQ